MLKVLHRTTDANKEALFLRVYIEITPLKLSGEFQKSTLFFFFFFLKSHESKLRKVEASLVYSVTTKLLSQNTFVYPSRWSQSLCHNLLIQLRSATLCGFMQLTAHLVLKLQSFALILLLVQSSLEGNREDMRHIVLEKEGKNREKKQTKKLKPSLKRDVFCLYK